jgi:hypothetical protein
VLAHRQRALWRIDAHGRTLIRTGYAAGLIRSVNSNRIAVLPSRTSVLILDQAGRVQRTFAFAPGKLQLTLTRAHLVTLERGNLGYLNSYNIADGRLQHSAKVPYDSHLLDATESFAVYTSQGSLHVLRFADSRDVQLLLPTRQGPLVAQIEDPGLYYVHKVAPRQNARIRVAFLPTRELEREIGN